MNNYSTEILQTIDTVVSARLNEVSFDRTEVCKIVSQNEKDDSKYWVTNDTIRFEAFADRRYVEGQKVYVLIPNGDYTAKKIILGSYEAENEDDRAKLWTNPFDHMVVSSKYNWVPWDNQGEPQYLKVPATQNKYADKTDLELQHTLLETGLNFYYSGLGQFNYIGLEFSALTGFGGTQGNFQIIIDLLDNEEKSLLSPTQLGLLTLDSSQLYGNPYYLTSALKLQHLFSFPIDDGENRFTDLTLVKKVKITLRSLDNFNYDDYDEDDPEYITIDDLTVYFGFDSSQTELSTSTLKLRLDNGVEETENLEYTDERDKKELFVEWLFVDDENQTISIYNKTKDQQYPEKNKYDIYWFQYDNSLNYVKRLESDIPVILSAYYVLDKDGNKIPEGDGYKINTLEKYKIEIDKVFPKKRIYKPLQDYNNKLYKEYLSWWKTTKTDFEAELDKHLDKDKEEEKTRIEELLNCYVERATNTPGEESEASQQKRKEQYGENLNNPNKIIIYEVLSKYNKEEYDFYCKLYKANETQFLRHLDNTFQDLEESGVYWKTVQKLDANSPQAYIYTLTPSKDWKSESVKALVKKKDSKDTLSSDKVYLFQNTKWRAETGSNQGKKDTLLLTLKEGDDGIYNSYGIDNRLLVNEGEAHTLTVNYIDSGLLWDNSIQKVIWKIPKTGSMITLAKEIDDNSTYKQVPGWIENDAEEPGFYTYTNNAQNGDAKTIKFGLNSQFNFTATNNTIYCKIIRYKDSTTSQIYDIYNGSITLQFGTQGTNGSGYALNIVPNSPSGLLLNGTNTIKYTATLESNDGSEVAFNGEKLTWSYQYGNRIYSAGDDAKGKTYSISSNTLTNIPGLPSNTDNPDIGNYLVLVAQLKDWTDVTGNNITLTAYYPLARTANKNYYITGAGKILYNYQGTGANYDNSNYCLYEYVNNAANTGEVISTPVSNIVWAIVFDGYDTKDSNDEYIYINAQKKNPKLNYTPLWYNKEQGKWGNIPMLRMDYNGADLDENKKAKPPEDIDYTQVLYSLQPMAHMPTNVVPTAVMALRFDDKSKTYETLYVQPLIITRNNYSFDELNSWNGALIIDPEKNQILTSLIAAGKKEDDNSYTGVLMGAVGQWGSAKSGIYGFKSGNLRYSLDENGDFYVGTGSDNRIDFSGSGENKTLTIEAANFTLKINNSEGKNQLYLSNQVNENDAWLQFKDKVYFYNNGTAQIGGWNIDKNQINSTTNRTIEGSSYSFKTFMQNGNAGTNAFGIGYFKDDQWNYPFRITHEGKLYATGANIEGKININSESTLNGTSVSKINTTTITSTPEQIALKAFTIKTDILTGEETTLKSYLKVQSDEISAKVSKNIGGNTKESMSWDLSSSNFVIKANNSTVMTVNSQGLSIRGSGNFSGTITVASDNNSNIGGWIVGGDGLYSQSGINGVGLYAGSSRDNIAIHAGANQQHVGTAPFRVYHTGKLVATKGEIAGWTIDPNSISKGNVLLSSGGGTNPIRFNADDIFKIYDNGRIEISPAPGFFVIGPDTSVKHPYMSAMNVAYGSGGLVTWTGSTMDNMGSRTAKIEAKGSKSITIQTFASDGGIYLEAGDIAVSRESPGGEVAWGATGYTNETISYYEVAGHKGSYYGIIHRLVYIKGICVGKVDSAASAYIYSNNNSDWKTEIRDSCLNLSATWYKNLSKLD